MGGRFDAGPSATGSNRLSGRGGGYLRLMGVDDSGTLVALKAHRWGLIDPKISEYGGGIVKTTGDGLRLDFPSIVDTVRCAVDVQHGMAERNAGTPRDRRLDFRIGINIGDIIIDGDDIHGDGVNLAARRFDLTATAARRTRMGRGDRKAVATST
jgi:class 3 adenylate cyclase